MIEELIIFLDQNAAAVIAALLMIGCAEVLIFLLFKLVRLYRSDHGGKKGYLQELGQNCAQLFLLFHLPDQIPVFVSENAEKLLGIRADSICRDPDILKQLIDGATDRRLMQELENWNRDSQFQTEFAYGRFQEDKNRYGKLIISRTEDTQYCLLMFEDISQEQEKREELMNQIKEVQAVDEAKTTFLSKMSHEIRTPMNGMLGMISLAKISAKGGNLDEVMDYLGKAEGLSKFLLSIINDILDMSRIESGKLELEQAAFDICGMAEKIRTMFQASIEDKGIHFGLELQDFEKHYLMGDELHITQVLSNFLSNASKFTPEGGSIHVTFRQMEVLDDKVTVMLRVKDTGKGMSADFLHRIFLPFEQEDSGIARKYGGSGLGMAISDSLVKMMGGQILIDSEEGKGTEFTVFITLPEAPESAVHKESSGQEKKIISLKGRRMLMAEDNKINAMVASRMLNHEGLLVETAANGRIALEMFAQHEPGYYDAILMDVHMPDMDGWEATKQIRRLERQDAARIPIIALSADAFVEDRRHSVEIGMNAHVTKPIDYQELEAVLMDEIGKE